MKNNSVKDYIKVDVDSILEKYDCVICFCRFQKPTVTKCGHTFCKECIDEVINRQHECPMCKTQLAKEDTVANFVLDSLLRNIEREKEKERQQYFDQMAEKAIQQNSHIL